MEHQFALLNGDKIEIIKKLHFKEYSELLGAMNTLSKILSQSQLFVMIMMNHHEYNKFLEECLKDFVKNGSKSASKMDRIVIETNRLALNLLTSIRSFLHHTETRLNREFGNDSKQLKQFKASCSREYENHFSYRFLNGLRNYAQHCGLPIGSVGLTYELVDENTNSVTYSIRAHISRDQLLESFDWKKLRKEIQDQPNEIDVTTHINSTVYSLKRIMIDLLAEDNDIARRSALKIKKLMEIKPEIAGTPCIVTTKDSQMSVQGVPAYLLDAVLDGFNSSTDRKQHD
ncbi:hypothetical protein J7643_13400 [bacterium]|nr:hypothetical protein [bacterium]